MKEYIERASVHSIIEQTSAIAFTRGGMHEKIDSLPAADVAPVRHGRWEMAPCNGVYDMRCSACGFCPGIRFFSSNYCPNCGALMDGKEDEHEAD